MKLSEILIISVTVIIIAFCIWLFYKSWYLGSNESDYDIVCLSNHEYFRASLGTKGFLAINLDDQGKPIRCTNTNQ